MHVSMSEIIGNFILIAGSFLLLIFLIKKFAWNNINGILEARAKRLQMILMEQNQLVKSWGTSK